MYSSKGNKKACRVTTFNGSVENSVDVLNSNSAYYDSESDEKGCIFTPSETNMNSNYTASNSQLGVHRSSGNNVISLLLTKIRATIDEVALCMNIQASQSAFKVSLHLLRTTFNNLDISINNSSIFLSANILLKYLLEAQRKGSQQQEQKVRAFAKDPRTNNFLLHQIWRILLVKIKFLPNVDIIN